MAWIAIFRHELVACRTLRQGLTPGTYTRGLCQNLFNYRFGTRPEQFRKEYKREAKIREAKIREEKIRK